MHSYTLLELNEYIKRVVALNFEDAIWIECEISNISEVRGQVYLDLIQKEEGSSDIVAQSSAAIWYKANLFIKSKLKDLYKSILANGIQVKCKVVVTYHERYGMKLSIEDVDASYTLGNLELEKQQILDKLKANDLLDLNKTTKLPEVIKNIAVVSSFTAAGYKDFLTQLTKNAYGYAYKVDLFQSAMQGVNTESEVCAAIYQIQNSFTQYDCIAILRGGGSKIDLSFFDNYKIAEAIATAKIPVITGIGHEIDLSVADLVAYEHLKTPTAIANYILDKTLHFESRFIDVYQLIVRSAEQRIAFEYEKLNTHAQTLAYLAEKKVLTIEKKLELAESQLTNTTIGLLEKMHQQLEAKASLIASYDPKAVLKRGYSIIEQNGKVVNRAIAVDPKQSITLQFYDGKVTKS